MRLSFMPTLILTQGRDPDDLADAERNASPGRHMLPPVGGSANGVDTGAVQKLLGAQLDAIAKQMTAHHEATNKQLSHLSSRIDAIASAKPAE